VLLTGTSHTHIALSHRNTPFLPPGFTEYLELQVPPCSSISRLSSYVRCTGKSVVISSTSGICSSVGAGVLLVFTQAWNIIAVALHIVGFPTDSCCSALSRCVAPASTALGSCCRSRQQSEALQPMVVATNLSRAEEGMHWGGGVSGSTGSRAGQEGRGRTLGGLGVSSVLAAPLVPNVSKGGYVPLTQDV
jgi:hypothetical protein